MPTSELRDRIAFRLSVVQEVCTHALFVFYVLTVGAIIDSNNVALPEKFLLYFVLPLFILDLFIRSISEPVAFRPIIQPFVSFLLWIAISYLVVLTASTILSSGIQPAVGHRIRAYLTWNAEAFLFLVVTAHLAVTYPQFLKRLLLLIGIFVFINAVINILAFLKITGMSSSAVFERRLEATFGTPPFHHSTHVAPLYAIYAMSLLGLAATTRLSRVEVSVVAICVPILLIGIVLTQSRGPILAVLICAILIACLGSWRWRAATVAAVLLSALALWASPPLRDAMLVRGTSTRPELWLAYLDLARIHPWIGYGLDRVLTLDIGGLPYEQPHNTFIWAQVRGGLAALLLALALMAGSFWAAFRWWLKTSDISLFAAIAVLGVVSITEVGFLVFPIGWLLVVFWLPIGLAIGAERACAMNPILNAHPQLQAVSTFLFPRILNALLKKGFVERTDPRDVAYPRRDRKAQAAVLITGASSGIGATYAERFAHRGHDLVLVGRDRGRLKKLAIKLHAVTGVHVDILPADLTVADQLAIVESRLRSDRRIGILVNNAGGTFPDGFSDPDLDAAEKLIDLNVTSVVRLTGAIVPRFLAEGRGAIINVSSALALVPEAALGIYGATKSFVLAFSQNLQAELGPEGVYVQAVLPAATATEIWERSGRDPKSIANIMDVNALVDAALVGFDRREAITIPALPDVEQWEAFEAARRAMTPNFRQTNPARRYRL